MFVFDRMTFRQIRFAGGPGKVEWGPGNVYTNKALGTAEEEYEEESRNIYI